MDNTNTLDDETLNKLSRLAYGESWDERKQWLHKHSAFIQAMQRSGKTMTAYAKIQNEIEKLK